jgi:hypothetical protein
MNSGRRFGTMGCNGHAWVFGENSLPERCPLFTSS